MLAKRLISRINQFEQCQDCLNKTYSKPPIAKLVMRSDQVLCSACNNTSLHIKPLSVLNDDLTEQPVVIFRKSYCKLHFKSNECTQCSIYLNQQNYSSCPDCGYSIYRLNMQRWMTLYPIYKCEMCEHTYCIKCRNHTQIFDKQYVTCSICDEYKISTRKSIIDFLLLLKTFKGFQFMMTIICIALAIPIQLIGEVAKKVKDQVWKPYKEITYREQLAQLAFLILFGPIIWLLWYTVMFIPYYIQSIRRHVAIVKVHFIK